MCNSLNSPVLAGFRVGEVEQMNEMHVHTRKGVNEPLCHLSMDGEPKLMAKLRYTRTHARTHRSGAAGAHSSPPADWRRPFRCVRADVPAFAHVCVYGYTLRIYGK